MATRFKIEETDRSCHQRHPRATAVTTNYVRKHVHKTTNDDTCRVCKSSKETIHHVISGGSVLAPTKYVQRHDNLCKYVHMLLVQKYDLQTGDEKWYEYDPVLENDRVKILWNFPVQTDHTVRHNKPDILVFEKISRSAMVIDIACLLYTSPSPRDRG